MTSWLEKAYWNTFAVWHVRHETTLPYGPLEDILALQNRRVRSMVKHAYTSVPYYRQAMDTAGLRPHDFQTADDLAQLPLVTKEQLARTPERFFSHAYRHRSTLQLRTSGTTGHTKTLHYDPAALFQALACGHRQRAVLASCVQRTFGYRELYAVRPGNVGMQLRHFYERHSWTPRTLDLQRALISPADSFATNIAQLNAFQPAVLRGYGSYLGALFRHAWQHQLTLFRPHAVVYGADRMADADRQLIETSYGVPVFSTYQAVEALRIAFQCERRAAFHLSLDQVAIRVVDAQGRTVGPGGSGELILSNLTNRATVLLNYQLGDVVSLSRDACPCGRSLPTLERIEGRADDLVVRPDGQVLHALMILGALRTVPELIQVQLVQEELQRFVLRAVVSPADAWPHLQPQVATCLRTLLGQHISLTLERVERIPPESSGKVRAVITHCQRPGSMP